MEEGVEEGSEGRGGGGMEEGVEREGKEGEGEGEKVEEGVEREGGKGRGRRWRRGWKDGSRPLIWYI